VQSRWSLQYALSLCELHADVATHSVDNDDETIAHLLPCKHDLHNSCLKPWVERANSCPICRAQFNMVELSQTVGGPVFDSYAVQEKIQQAEMDPSMFAEDELFAIEAWEPCMVCGAPDETNEFIYCDGCESAIHVFCAGLDDAPERGWLCHECVEADGGVAALSSTRSRPRRRAAGGRADRLWARVWQQVSRRLDMDLDFPHDEEDAEERTPEQQTELRHWQRRLEVASANQSAATERLRNIAEGNLQAARQSAPPPDPESQEELRAWNAFDKARESRDAPQAVRRRKRKATASPASPHEPEVVDQPQLKRPRLRRPPASLEPQVAAESSGAAALRTDERSTFLSSLLKDVETKPMSAGSPGASEQHNGQYSPRNSSPARSPTVSGHNTPRASPSPPYRPMSPPLSSTIVPISSPVVGTFSPFSPTGDDQRHATGFQRRGRPRSGSQDHRTSEDENEDLHRSRATSTSPASPSRASLSFSTKAEIQRMVKSALNPRYRDKEISKDQYTDINRDISRKMYDMVGDVSALADQNEREKWQAVAEAEVKKAVDALHFGSREQAPA
jgi:hypothetical protein